MGKMHLYIYSAILLCAFLSAPLMAATYYISPSGSDSNLGSITSPWRTMGKASSTIVAGDTAIAMDGTYTEGQVNFSNNGTAANRITLRAQNKHKAVLSSISHCQPNISISASYVTIEDIRISISPNNVKCSPVDSASGTGVRCWGSNSPTQSNPSTGWVGCTIRGVLIDASPARGHGIKTNQDYALVENNEVYSGIEAMTSFGNIYRNNLVIGGDWWGNSLLSKGGSRSFQAYNNVIIQKPGGWLGLILGGAPPAQWAYAPGGETTACYNCVAYNNVIINEAGSNALSLGSMGAHNSAVYNNIVINGKLTQLDDTRNMIFKNNIVSCGGGAALGSGFSWNYTGSLTLDYNNFFNCSGLPFQTHAIVGDPKFVAADNWHINSGSSAVGTGTPVSFLGFNGESIDVSRDKDGVSRTNPWSLGIYAGTGGVIIPPTNLRFK